MLPIFNNLRIFLFKKYINAICKLYLRRMLSQKEQEGCRQLLELLNNETLLSLATTTMRGQIIVTSKHEAIDVIVRYSESGEDLLRRRKIPRDTLFQYLVSLGIVISPASVKEQLIRRILEFWNSSLAINYARQDEIHADSKQGDARVLPTDSTQHSELGLAFISWYFHSLNAQNPDCGDRAMEFGPQHFYADARLMVRMRSKGEDRVDDYDGAHALCMRLLQLVQQERLRFNPNCLEGEVEVQKERHGVVMVVCCGTVHRVGQWVGLFEQATMIVKDPMQANNWKIKELRLNMKSQDGSTRALTTSREIRAILV